MYTKLMTAFVFAFSLTAMGAEYKIDNVHSNVGFTVRHLVAKVSGEFSDYAGVIHFDSAKPEASKIEAKIQVRSINTRNEKRDGHLRSPDFFDAEKFPEMTFVSKKVTGAGKDKYKMAGDLTMHGVTKPVTLDVEFLGAGKNPQGGESVGFAATGKVNRKDFGINWNKALDAGGFVLGDEVTININIEGAGTGKKM